ncbi:unnamed protein product [Prorocentrum cordatum]|uniref:Glutathione transferase n=1 Tax=Prorocentrum cordatum TaxID=2364126 RepID=A0ABN9TJE8_9DINO|nr:unnamed protein product [Polarella glacialis]
MADPMEPGEGMTLYHSASSRAFRVLWALHEMGIADQCKLITMPFPPRVFVKEFLKKNVLGTIPFFVDKGGKVQMTESCAIPQYIAQAYGPTSLETVVLRYTLQERGRADQAAEDYGKWYLARLRLLDGALSDGREFLCSGRFTIADVCIAYALLLGTRFGFDKRYSPQVKAYLDRMSERAAFRAAQDHEARSAAEFEALVQASSYKRLKSMVHDELKNFFKPEFLNRLDEIIVFKSLTKPEVAQIAELEFKKTFGRTAERGIKLTMTDRFKQKVIDEGFNPVYGARPLRRAIMRLVEDDELAESFLKEPTVEGECILLDKDGDGNVVVLRNQEAPEGGADALEDAGDGEKVAEPVEA